MPQQNRPFKTPDKTNPDKTINYFDEATGSKNGAENKDAEVDNGFFETDETTVQTPAINESQKNLDNDEDMDDDDLTEIHTKELKEDEKVDNDVDEDDDDAGNKDVRTETGLSH
jgi:hypothetical protein